MNLLESTPNGLYCEAGDFYVDPWRPVKRALITHAHSDHAREGSEQYYCTEGSHPILRHRLGTAAPFKTFSYGQRFSLGSCEVSFHPAGHVLGSAQVRIANGSKTWVVSGDYKRDPDPTCAPFEPVECDTFITEATFALPIYRWDPASEIAADILQWWDRSRALGKTCVLFAYSLGKAQRLLGELALLTDRTVFTHGAVESITQIYRESGIKMLPTEKVDDAKKRNYAGELVIAPPSAFGSPWCRRFGDLEKGFASGWMRLRGNRRRRGYDRGFTLSDHADWPSLLQTIKETKAKRILVTHGGVDPLIQYLKEQGTDAAALSTTFEGEGDF